MKITFNNKQHETKISTYGEHSFIVCDIPTEEYDYILLGGDIPEEGAPDWLFWVEYGNKDGSADTKKWDISEIEREYLKVEILDFILNNKKETK